MQISSRFTIAMQILTCIDVYEGQELTTSEFLASSVNVNPVIIRKILQQLKAAELVTVKRGSGGASLAHSAAQITLYDVFEAVESLEDGQLFHFHDYPNPNDPVGRNIHAVMDPRLLRVQEAMEGELKRMTLSQVIADIKPYIERDAEERAKKRAAWDL